MAVFDGYGRFLRVWKRMRWEKLAEEEFFEKNILNIKLIIDYFIDQRGKDNG